MSFTHLHLHTEYSLLDGAIRLKDLGPRLRELGMSSCAITDHGVLYGTVDFYRAMRKEGIKPILGCEVYVAPRGMEDKSGAADREPSHLILLAETQQGWRNLIKLCSLAFTRGFYYRPRVDMETLERYHEGLIALSACLGGAVPRALLGEGYESAKAVALRHDAIFGRGSYYLELQDNGIPEQTEVNHALIRMSAETGIPLVASNDCHYLLKEDALAQDVLLCLQTAKKLADQDRMRMETSEFYLKSPEEMAEAFRHVPEAILNTARIAERCQADIEFGRLYLPEFKAENGMDSEPYLRSLCFRGLEERLAHHPEKLQRHRREAYEERLRRELDVITSMGYTDYYLVVWDYIRYAREEGIMVGPGRGSGAASLAAYCLKITNVDPLVYDLIFERFLNPERVSMPDFDCDFSDNRRAEMIEYVTRKYGTEHVCQVITFGTLAAKACVRDVARVLDLPFAEGDRLAKMIPFQLNVTIDDAIRQNPDLRRELETNPESRELFDLAKKLEGMPRHASTHAAGVIIAAVPVMEVAPLSLNDEAVVVQYTKDNIEDIGLLKFDFLGLRILSVLQDTARLVKENGGPDIDFDNMSFDDPAVYKMLSEGRTAGVFQLEATGMTNFIKEMKPSSFEDIIAGISLYRPGPMEQIPRYLAAGKTDCLSCDHPLLDPILKTTRGCMVYQEQVMQIVRRLAGFSMGQADNVRRAMGKKKPEVMATYRELFIRGGRDEKGVPIPGAAAQGVDEATAAKIFEEMMAFAGYAFNKAHAAGYAVIAYQTAWLKHYYPVEFLAATLNSFLGVLDKAAGYVRVCRDMGIKVLPPDINKSQVRFTTEGGAIRFALGAIKNLGEGAMQALVREREENGAFRSFADLISRACDLELNRKAIESLIKSSACDGFGIPRSQLLEVSDLTMQRIQMSKRQHWEGQISLFDLSGAGVSVPEEPHYPAISEYPLVELLAQEKEMLGLYISGHPLDSYTAAMTRFCSHNGADLRQGQDEKEERFEEPLQDRQEAVMAGQLVKQRVLLTRKQEQMAFLTLEDLDGLFEMIVFPKNYQKYRQLFQEGQVLIAAGSLSVREDEEAKLIVENLAVLEPDWEKLPDGWRTPSAEWRKSGGERKAPPRQMAGDRGMSEGRPATPEPPSARGGDAGAAASPGIRSGEGTVPSVGAADAPRLVIRWLEEPESVNTRHLKAMLRYFGGSSELWLLAADGKPRRLDFGFDLSYLPFLIRRYGEESFALF